MKHAKLVYSIDPSGRIDGLYDDELDFSSLGNQTVTRATSIDHNPITQLFDVVLLPDGECFEPCKGFTKYSHGNSFEVAWLQKCRIDQVTPQSIKGQILASEARTSIDLQLEIARGTGTIQKTTKNK